MLFHTPRSVIDKNSISKIQGYLDAATSNFKYPKISMGKCFRTPENELQAALPKNLDNFFWNSPIPDFYRNTFFREPLLLVEFLTIRFHKPGDTKANVEWHLDANFYGFTVPLITAWMPLVEVGHNAPGIEFAVPNNAFNDYEMREIWTGIDINENKNRIVKDEYLEQFLGCPFRRHAVPMNPGDVCIFDQFMLHRTQFMPNATNSRTALEFRVADRNFLPPDIDQFKSRGMLVSWKDYDNKEPNIGFLHNLFPHILNKPT